MPFIRFSSLRNQHLIWSNVNCKTNGLGTSSHAWLRLVFKHQWQACDNSPRNQGGLMWAAITPRVVARLPGPVSTSRFGFRFRSSGRGCRGGTMAIVDAQPRGGLVESCICIQSKVNGNTAKAGCTSFLVKCVERCADNSHVACLEYAMLSHRRISKRDRVMICFRSIRNVKGHRMRARYPCSHLPCSTKSRDYREARKNSTSEKATKAKANYQVENNHVGMRREIATC